VLIATDCLSEGINLQDRFTAVLHYDLPWNPNRLEQREGRVDRFGQIAPVVKGLPALRRRQPDRRHRARCAAAQGARDQARHRHQRALPGRLAKHHRHHHPGAAAQPEPPDRNSRSAWQATDLFDFGDFDEAASAKAKVTRKVDEAAEREKASRSIFAQHAIKAHEIEADLREVDEAIGDPKAVETFVTSVLNNLLGVQVVRNGKGYRHYVTGNLPPRCATCCRPAT
jgi:superfamily II DNA/RNA helicase